MTASEHDGKSGRHDSFSGEIGWEPFCVLLSVQNIFYFSDTDINTSSLSSHGGLAQLQIERSGNPVKNVKLNSVMQKAQLAGNMTDLRNQLVKQNLSEEINSPMVLCRCSSFFPFTVSPVIQVKCAE